MTVHFFDGNYEWAKEKLPAFVCDSADVPIPPTAKKVKEIVNEKQKNLDDLEEMIEQIEINIHLLQKQMESESDLSLLQSIYSELEMLENEREQLYQQLDEVV